jgi:folate-binding protein YgfZ
MRSLPLEAVHLDAGATLDQWGGAQVALSYGDAPTAALRARTGGALWDRSHRSTLRVSGPDRASWLQGMITNDVLKLAVGEGCRAAVVTSKGRMVAEIQVHRRQDELWLETSADRAEPLLTHLNRFIIMEDCQVEDRSTQFALLSLVGPHSTERLRGIVEHLPELPPFTQLEVRLRDPGELPIVAARNDAFGLEQVDLWVDPAMAATVWMRAREAGAEPIGSDSMEILRIESGRPRFGAELDEETIPLEAGFRDAISYDKGCYIGQEIIARVTYRGHVNRELRGLILDGPPPTPPVPLLRGDESAGEMRSVTRSAWLDRSIGLGFVKRDALAEGTELQLSTGGKARVCSLPFRQPD